MRYRYFPITAGLNIFFRQAYLTRATADAELAFQTMDHLSAALETHSRLLRFYPSGVNATMR